MWLPCIYRPGRRLKKVLYEVFWGLLFSENCSERTMQKSGEQSLWQSLQRDDGEISESNNLDKVGEDQLEGPMEVIRCG